MPHPEEDAADHGEPARIDGLVMLSLRRSQARSQVLGFLAGQGASYPTLIAEGTGLGLNTVLGAIRGAGDRYSLSLSLEALGLVQEVRPDGLGASGVTRFYEITEKGALAVSKVQD